MKTTEEKIQVLSEIAKRLNEEKILWAAGASVMLYLRNLVSEFNDLDLMVGEDDALRVREILLKMGTLKESAAGSYATEHFYEFTIDGVDVDIMGGFRIVKDGTVYDCHLKSEDIKDSILVNGVIIPLDSLRNWLHYYKLMGRSQRVKVIRRHLLKPYLD
ncbi:MAG TPA: hypothetical protein PLI19_02885 [Erysipelotrichaceae bacterium]|mgnify:CR=1 FL=1|nr:hypothetical protein [Erysipelotrichaceae bacterium]HQB32256.1 hypothetical protein [Erysipelotrichaceae bacterium]